MASSWKKCKLLFPEKKKKYPHNMHHSVEHYLNLLYILFWNVINHDFQCSNKFSVTDSLPLNLLFMKLELL